MPFEFDGAPLPLRIVFATVAVVLPAALGFIAEVAIGACRDVSAITSDVAITVRIRIMGPPGPLGVEFSLRSGTPQPNGASPAPNHVKTW